MSAEFKALADRVAALEAHVAGLASYLQASLGNVSSDPQNSLTKSRVVLEKLLRPLYLAHMKKDPPGPMIGNMLGDKAFTAKIDSRIIVRMNAIKDMGNLGTHGCKVDASDAIRVMRDLLDVLEWYVANHDPGCLLSGNREDRHALEILPELKNKYGNTVCRKILSAKLVRSEDRCYLDITTDNGQGYLTSTYSLDIYWGEFDPKWTIVEVANRFVSSFGIRRIVLNTVL